VPSALAGRIVPGPPAPPGPGAAPPEHHLDPLVPDEPHAPAIEVAPTPPPLVSPWSRTPSDPEPATAETEAPGNDADPTPSTATIDADVPPAGAPAVTSTETAAPAAGTDDPERASTTTASADLLPPGVAPAVTATGTDTDAPPVITTEPLLIEGAPDESSRRRGRLVRFGLGALVALVSLVVLVLVILDSTTNDAGTPTTAQPVPEVTTGTEAAPASETLSLPTVLMPSGMVVARTWELTGSDGNELVATVDISNPTPQVKSDQIIEVIPKALAANVTQVRFEGATPVVLRADPIVRFDVTLQPGQRTRIGYRITVPADGVDPDRLALWKANRETEQKAFDAIMNLTVPRRPIKPAG
jgi:hypothetical protein